MNIPDITAQINEWNEDSLAETMGCRATAKAIKALPDLLEVVRYMTSDAHGTITHAAALPDNAPVHVAVSAGWIRQARAAMLKAGATE